MGSNTKSINQSTNGPTKTSKPKPNNGNSDTQQTEKEEGRKRGRPRKQPEPARGEEKTILPRLVDVEIPTPDIGEGEAAAPKKPARKKAAAPKKNNLTAANVAGILKASFDIIGNREGLELWKLDQKECDQLAEPLAKIIAKSTYMERVTDEYGEYIALIIAIGMIIIPRFMMQLKQNKENKKNDLEKKREKKQNDERTHNGPRTEGNENRTIGTGDKPATQSTTYGNEIINTKFHESIPFIQL